jgi:glycosyltransferase involved in cell wall biosynthesis
MPNPGISFIMPAFNEGPAIVVSLERLIKSLAGIKLPCEIILVNDGSTDNTRLLLSKFTDVKIINHPVNVGYGNALKSGIRTARYDWVGIVDADGSYPIEDLPKLIAEMQNGFDMVIGIRANMEQLDKPVKRMSRWLYGKVLNLVVKCNIADANSGFRVFKREMALSFLPFLCGTFSFTTSLTILATGNYFFVKQVPIQYHPRTGKSKVKHVRDSIRTLQYIVQGITFFNPIKFFMILSVCMIFVVCIPAMVFAVFRMPTLSLYYIIFGTTVTVLIALGALGDIIRISMIKAREHN